jgi:hypothetical protein
MEHAAVALSVAARAGISKKRPRPDLSTFLPTDPVNASDESSQSSSHGGGLAPREQARAKFFSRNA